MTFEGLHHPAWADIIANFSEYFREPENLPCSEWNEKYRFLPNGLPFKCWPWQREILDAASDEEVGEIILMMPSQIIGKSELLLGILCHQIVTRPGYDYLLVLPSLPLCERWSRTRFAQTVRWSPILQALLPGEGKRTLASSGSKLLFKQFTNGSTLAIATANSAPALAAASIRGLFADETDRWERELVGEGSPFSLAARRLTSFSDSLFVQASSPTIQDESHIEEEYLRSDRRSWLIPCPGCGHSFELKWANVKWPKAESGKPKFEAAGVECSGCGGLHDDATRRLMVMNGHWGIGDPSIRRTRGYWMSGFNVLLPTRKGYESRLHEMALEFWQAKGSPITLQPWVNLTSGESWKREEVKAMPIEFLLQRREDYFSGELPDQARVILPAGVLILTAAIDIQIGHIESVVVGWNRTRTSWLIDHRRWEGNPSEGATWAPLHQYLLTGWVTGSGELDTIKPALTLIDSGYLPDVSRRFCRAAGRRLPSKGVGSVALPWVTRALTSDKKVYVQLHTDAGKFALMSYLAIADPKQPGYMHFPAHVDSEFFRQLTSEYVQQDERRHRLVFQKIPNVRNEVLDLYVMVLGALEFLRIPESSWAQMERERQVVRTPSPTSAQSESAAPSSPEGLPVSPVAISPPPIIPPRFRPQRPRKTW